MLKTPSCRRRGSNDQKPNMTPILDAIFILIFFLIMSASFIKIYEIASDVPLISSKPAPPSKKKPLALTLHINASNMAMLTGIPGKVIQNFPKRDDGEYDFETLRAYLIENIKKKHPEERSIVLEPKIDLKYEVIVKVMDAVRILKKTDPAFFTKKKGDFGSFDERHFNLFDKIVFGNIQSFAN